MSREGARVVVSDINAASADAICEAITTAGGTAIAAQLDVIQADAAAELASDLQDRGWSIDLLVNNAGIGPRSDIDSPEFSNNWHLTMDINLSVSRAFVPQLRESRGTIVNIASIAAFVSVLSTLAYMASKAGVKGLTQAMAVELGSDRHRGACRLSRAAGLALTIWGCGTMSRRRA